MEWFILLIKEFSTSLTHVFKIENKKLAQLPIVYVVQQSHIGR